MTDFLALITAALPEYLRDLEQMVNLECGTHNKAGVDAVSAMVREHMADFGMQMTEFPQEQYGDMVYGCLRGRGTTRILMLGHLDTVYPDGSAQTHPFRQAGPRLMGPGVSDMKSGLLSGLFALRALAQCGFDDFAEIGLFCNSEEEIGSPASRSLYAPYARASHAVFVLEAARANGAIVSARKGGGRYTVRVRGRAAHAGVAPETGANAILALAHAIVALQGLNGLRPGLTVNVGTVHGGTRPNVVPDAAEAQVDVRIVRAADAAPLEQAIAAIVAAETVPGTSASLEGGLNGPPMEKTPATAHLVALAQRAADRLGFPLADVSTGGSSDGNFTAALGAPTLDGLGPVGGNAHNLEAEYLDADTIVPRTALLAMLLVAVAEEGRPARGRQ